VHTAVDPQTHSAVEPGKPWHVTTVRSVTLLSSPWHLPRLRFHSAQNLQENILTGRDLD